VELSLIKILAGVDLDSGNCVGWINVITRENYAIGGDYAFARFVSSKNAAGVASVTKT